MSSTRCLQILDDGRLTDSQGRVVDFKNTIIIMTSNIGSRLPDRGRVRDLVGEISRRRRAKKVMSDLRAHFRPEFLNRVDEIVLFKPLTMTEITHIVDLLLQAAAIAAGGAAHRARANQVAPRNCSRGAATIRSTAHAR